MSGWIKLHRSLLEWQWYDDINATRLIIHLLISVNYEKKQWHGITVNPGTIITSFEKLSEATGLTLKQVRLAMDKLESSGEVARKRADKGQAITLVKWDKLQSDEEKRASKRAEQGQIEGRLRATTKEGEESKEFKEDNKFSFKKSLLEICSDENLIDDWLKVRKDKSASNTQTAFTRIKNEILKSNLPAEYCIRIAVEKSWKGFEAKWLENLGGNFGTETPKRTLVIHTEPYTR